MKIIQIISGLMYGGGQKVAIDLHLGLTILGCDSKMCLLGTKGERWEPEDRSAIPYDGRYNRPLSVLSTARALRVVLKEQQPDLIHTHGWDADIIGALATLGLPILQVAHQHVTTPWMLSRRLRHRVRGWLTRRLLQREQVRLIAVSEAVRRHMIQGVRIDPARIHVVHNGVDCDFLQRTSGESVPQIRIGCAARLAPMKGIDVLIDAVRRLAQEGRSFSLRVAGEGPLRTELEDRIREWNLDDRVRFAGRLSEMKPFYDEIDLFVLPSRSTEGLPLTVLEAMAMECAVIATPVGGTPEVLRDGKEGLLVEAGSAEGLAAALARLMDHPQERRKLAENGRKRVMDGFQLRDFLSGCLRHYLEHQSIRSGSPADTSATGESF